MIFLSQRLNRLETLLKVFAKNELPDRTNEYGIHNNNTLILLLMTFKRRVK